MVSSDDPSDGHELETLLDDLEQQEAYSADNDDEKLVDTSVSKRRSTAYLDGLRGLAALCVFNGHFMGGGDHERGFGQMLPDGISRNWHVISFPLLRFTYTAGPAAVSIFFVLSGFVITQTLVKLIKDGKHKQTVRAFASAAIRRPIRLYLPVWAVTFIIAMALHLPWHIYPPLPWLEARDSIWIEVLRWTETTWNWFWPFKRHFANEPMYIYDLVVWTIPIELQGSFLCYSILALYGLASWQLRSSATFQRGSVGILVLLVLTGLFFAAWWQACFVAGLTLSIIDVLALDQNLLTQEISFPFAGKRHALKMSRIALTAMWLSSWYLLAIPQASANPEWLIATPGYGWLAYLVPNTYDANNIEPYRLYTSLGAIGFVYATLRLDFLQWFFGTKPLQYLGKVSFMLYLIHLPWAYCFTDRMSRIFGKPSYAPVQEWNDGLLWLPEWGLAGFNVRSLPTYSIALLSNLCLAELATRFLDEPFVRLGRFITERLRLDVPKPVQ